MYLILAFPGGVAKIKFKFIAKIWCALKLDHAGRVPDLILATRAGRDLILATRAGHAKIRSAPDLILALTEFNFSAYLILARTNF